MSQPTDTAPDQATQPRLGFWDTVSIIIGIVIGAAIFRAPKLIFEKTAGPGPALLAWTLGGLLSLAGAFCYAELATTYTRAGGDYYYQKKAYGRFVAFLFAWSQLTVLVTANICSMAFVFADYGRSLWAYNPAYSPVVAAIVIVVLSLLNLLGILVGKTLQNALSATKVIGLAAIILAGLMASGQPPEIPETAPVEPAFGLAMVFVLYAYGGWNDAAFVAAEVRNRRRNIPWALIAGVLGVTAIYLLINLAYLATLGIDGARHSTTPAADALRNVLGTPAAKAISLLVMISALGAVNGVILTGSRINAAVGADYRRMAWLGIWNSRGAPVYAIILQALISVVMILAVATATGRFVLDSLMRSLGQDGMPWQKYGAGFETIVTATAPIFWLFFMLTGIASIVLRLTDPDVQRPFRMPLFPLPALLFIATCGYLLYSSLDYARTLALLGLIPLAAGVPAFWRCRTQQPTS